MNPNVSHRLAAVAVAALALSTSPNVLVPTSIFAQGAAAGTRLEVLPGTKASYRVREQLAGVSFPNDAVGSTDKVEGQLVFGADGTIDAAQSKLTVDLKTLKSDQPRRDAYLQRATLQTEQFATAVFVPRKVVGLPYPIPTNPDGAPKVVGFQLVGDMTIHGVTKELTWNVVTAVTPDKITGNATASFSFAQFNLTKPTVAVLMSVEDQIKLELELQLKKGG